MFLFVKYINDEYDFTINLFEIFIYKWKTYSIMQIELATYL